VGEILGRSFALPLRPEALDEADEETRPEPVHPMPPDPEGDHQT